MHEGSNARHAVLCTLAGVARAGSRVCRHRDGTCLAVFGQGVLLRARPVQHLLALAVQDDHVGEARLLDLQSRERQLEDAAGIWHQPLQGHPLHYLPKKPMQSECEGRTSMFWQSKV